ncbi:MAG: hypothetical protein U0169_07925 [Polyangiaceae bacterium]
MLTWSRIATTAFAVSLVGSMTLLGQGCSVSVGSDLDGGDFTGLDASTTVDGAANADASAIVPPEKYACYGCLRNTCSAQWAVCQNNADCLGIYQCATSAACITNRACTDQCYLDRPNGQTAYDAFFACNDQATCSTCSVECQPSATQCPGGITVPDAGTTPADAGTTPADSGTTTDSGVVVDASPVDECGACNAAQCATEDAACKPNTDCAKFQNCVGLCTDSACATKCASDNPAGAQANTALATCSIAKCAGPCGL